MKDLEISVQNDAIAAENQRTLSVFCGANSNY